MCGLDALNIYTELLGSTGDVGYLTSILPALLDEYAYWMQVRVMRVCVRVRSVGGCSLLGL